MTAVTAAVCVAFSAGCRGTDEPLSPRRSSSPERDVAGHADAVAATAAVAAPVCAFDSPSHQMFYTAIVATSDRGGFLSNESFIMNWYLIGPVSFRDAGAGSGVKNIIHHEFMAGEKIPPRQGLEWRYSAYMGVKNIGEINLNRVCGDLEPYSAVYALTLLHAPSKMEQLTLHTGSDDYLKIWLNGSLVHTYNREPRQAAIDQDRIPNINLRQGYNLLVVKTVGAGSTRRFFLRFTDAADAPVTFAQKTIAAGELEKHFRRFEKETGD